MQASKQESFLGKQFGSYRLKELLAERAASNLYLAQKIDSDQPVFLEVLHSFIDSRSDLAVQFKQRMETVAQLEHPGIAAIKDMSTDATDVIYAVIEYVPGLSLSEKLSKSRENVSPVVDALALVRKIAAALAVAHSAGIIHHDLRPRNVLISESNEPVFIDLGLPIVANVSPATAGEENGKIDYTPPEQLQGKKLTIQGNIYSLGIILYELLAGHRPQLQSSPWDIFEHTTLSKEIALEEDREGLHPATYQLVKDSLRRQEWARYETMEEMITAIDAAIAAEHSEVADKASTGATIPRPLWGVATAGLVLLALLFLLWFRNGRTDAGAGMAQLETAGPEQSEPVPAALAEPTETLSPTATLSPTPILTPTLPVTVPINLLAPANGREVSSEDDLTFGWSYVISLEAGQQFVIYLLSGGREVERLGAVDEPVLDTHYRLIVDIDELDLPAGTYDWQVVIEEVTTNEKLNASSLFAITFLEPSPTPTPSPTATRTPSPTPTPCVRSPLPGWVEYTVQVGDALYVLAVARGTTVAEVRRVNCLENDVIGAGRTLWLPRLPATETPTVTNTPLPTPTATEGTLPPPPPLPPPPSPPTEEPTTAEPPTLTPPAP